MGGPWDCACEGRAGGHLHNAPDAVWFGHIQPLGGPSPGCTRNNPQGQLLAGVALHKVQHLPPVCWLDEHRPRMCSTCVAGWVTPMNLSASRPAAF